MVRTVTALAALGLAFGVITGAEAQSLNDLIKGKDGPGAPVLTPGGDQREGGGAAAGTDPARGAAGADGPPPPLDDGGTPPPLIDIEYWYTAGGKNHGPYTFADMKRLVDAGTLTPTSKIWHKGLPGWTDAKAEPTLAGLFGPGPGPGPDVGGGDAWKTFLSGTWEATTTQDPLTVKANQTFMPDGKVMTVLTYYGPDLMNPGNLVLLNSISLSGVWQVAPMSAERFQLTITTTKAQDPTIVLDKKPQSFVIVRTGPNSLKNDSDGSSWQRVR